MGSKRPLSAVEEWMVDKALKGIGTLVPFYLAWQFKRR